MAVVFRPLNNGTAPVNRFRFTLAVVAIILTVSARRSNEAQVSGSPRLVPPRLEYSFLRARHFGPLAFARHACVDQNPVSQWAICWGGKQWDNTHLARWQGVDRPKLRDYEGPERCDMGIWPAELFHCCGEGRDDSEIIGWRELDGSDHALFVRPERCDSSGWFWQFYCGDYRLDNGYAKFT